MTFDSPVWLTPIGHEMRGVLARLELVSAGTTASWTSAGGDSEHGPQSGDSNPEFMTFRRRFENAPEHKHGTILQEARDHLEALTGRASRDKRPAGETDEQAIGRMLRDTQGWTPSEVAASRFRMSETVVRKARRQTGRDPETGKLPHDPVQQKVLSMIASGKTQRYIAMKLDVSQATVSRMCRARQKGARAA